MQGRNGRRVSQRRPLVSYRAVALLCLLGALLYFAWCPHCGVQWTIHTANRPDIVAENDRSSADPAENNYSTQPTSEVGSNFPAVESDAFLDPKPSGVFIVAVEVSVDEAPAVGKQAKFLYKYAADTPPYPGWAIGLRTYETSVRPEIYWQSADGQGGWYTFDEVHLKRGLWYVFSLVASEKLISLYLQEGVGRERSGEKVAANAPRQSSEASLHFLGGYDTGELSLPRSDGKLYFRSSASTEGSSHSAVGQVLICQTQTLSMTSEGIRSMLSGGVRKMAAVLAPDEISLWIDETGKDRSRFERPIYGLPNNS
jgi:hypothetical protein